MDAELLFHLTGRRSGSLRDADGSWPALLAPFRDLSRLRYAFPVVLTDDGGVRPLSAIVDERCGSRRAERALRVLLAEGRRDRLADALEAAAPGATGEVVDCDASAPRRIVEHIWRAAGARRAAPLRRLADELTLRLSDLVRADLARSIEGRRPGALRASVGGPFRELFDFELLAHLVATPSGAVALTGRRRRRIDDALAALRRDRALLDAGRTLVFDRLDGAVAAQRERVPLVAALLRAIAVAELELEGRYVEAEHDAYVAAIDEDAIRAADLTSFPTPLAVLPAGRGAAGRAQVLGALLDAAPIRILVETDDALGPDADLALAATSIAGVFVVQAPASHLPAASDAIAAAFAHPGPSLISVYTGAVGGAAPYLVSAAAIESRAFPAFSWDPTEHDAHPRLIAIPQADAAWPEHDLRYSDERGQRVIERVAFTVADLALLDPRRADHFAVVPHEHWERLGPVAEANGTIPGPGAPIPSVIAVDGEDRVQRLVVDQRLVAVARRRADAWSRLGRLARADAPQRDAPAAELDAATASIETLPAATAAAAPGPVTDPDAPYIETARCSSCNECTLLNPRMFAYNADRQAYIADVSAGTFRDLVEAAEACQVAIIHPGAPRDPNEPGIEELRERAAAFA